MLLNVNAQETSQEEHVVEDSNTASTEETTTTSTAVKATTKEQSQSPKECETLYKFTLEYQQHEAPRDISDVMRVVVDKLNYELSGILNVNVKWAGTDIHRKVGYHYVETSVEHIVTPVTMNSDDPEEDDNNNENDTTSSSSSSSTSCFMVPLHILDTDECSLPTGHEWHHKCHSTSFCINTRGSYECVCPLLVKANYHTDKQGTDRNHVLKQQLSQWQHEEQEMYRQLDNSRNSSTTTSDSKLDEKTIQHELNEKWDGIVGTRKSRFYWELSLPSSSSSTSTSSTGSTNQMGCTGGEEASTKHCCSSMGDPHSSKGQSCRANFVCPTDPCLIPNTVRNPSRTTKSMTNQCVPEAQCSRLMKPWEKPYNYECLCPEGTLGNGRYCFSSSSSSERHLDVIKVKQDGITPVASTLPSTHKDYLDVSTLCGCTPTMVDLCADFVCPYQNQICVIEENFGTTTNNDEPATATSQPTCICQDGYVLHEEYGCIDKTPPKLQLKTCHGDNVRPAQGESGVSVYRQGDIYKECAIDIVDDNAEDFFRYLQMDYSEMYKPLGHCFTNVGTYKVTYTVATSWTVPSKTQVVRTVKVTDIDECHIGESSNSMDFYKLERKCPQVIPHCDVQHGATCLNLDGTYTCQCPKYTTGDGFIPIRDYTIGDSSSTSTTTGVFSPPQGYKGGTGCRDTTKPVIQLKGSNPKIFQIAKTSTLRGILAMNGTLVNSFENDNLGGVPQRAQTLANEAQTLLRSYYEEQIQYMIVQTNGAELCASSTTKPSKFKKHHHHSHRSSFRNKFKHGGVTSPLDCVYAYDQTYNETIDLSSRVVIGSLEPMGSDPYRWRIPYDVMDDAGNTATTIYRDVMVDEIDLFETLSKTSQDMSEEEHVLDEEYDQMEEHYLKEISQLKTKLHYTEQQLQQTQRRSGASATSRDNSNNKCPPCPPCDTASADSETCPSTDADSSTTSTMDCLKDCDQYCLEHYPVNGENKRSPELPSSSSSTSSSSSVPPTYFSSQHDEENYQHPLMERSIRVFTIVAEEIGNTMATIVGVVIVMACTILGLFCLYICYYLLTSCCRRSNVVYYNETNWEDEYEAERHRRELFNTSSVTYHASPSPTNNRRQANGSSTTNGSAHSSNGAGTGPAPYDNPFPRAPGSGGGTTSSQFGSPPPRTSRLFSPPSASTQQQPQYDHGDDIYANLSPIRPSRSGTPMSRTMGGVGSGSHQRGL